MNNKTVLNFRNALKMFALIKMNYRIDKGDFDNVIERFLEGDELNFCFNITLIPNDILIMRHLSGGKIDKKIIKKVTNLWNKEKNE